MPPSSRDEEPDSKSSSRDNPRFNTYFQQISKHGASNEDEYEPLLSGPSTPRKARRHNTLDSAFGGASVNSEHVIIHHSSDEPNFFNFIMEKVRGTKVAYWADRVAVESEPGLTNAQLMLHNHDLKPGV